MAATLSVCLAALSLLYVLFKCISFTRFYIHGRRSGFPIYVSPFPSKNILWMATTPMLQPLLERYLPRRLSARVDMAIFAWEFRRRRNIPGLGKHLFW
ncbi:hypothetical protein BJX63DRAFT_417165 [Aspergillus granulosus]|uniref:Secreted protein n=1 Tax=Aspergillus granulosus TaxID=176169 RepID=A0ABR4GSV3_9EURO